MKQKINVVIHSTGSNNGFILECIAEMNKGKTNFSARDLEGYLAMKKAWMPLSGDGYLLRKDENEPNTYHVSDDGGKTFSLSLEWVEIHDLKTEPEIPTFEETQQDAKYFKEHPEETNDDLKNVFN